MENPLGLLRNQIYRLFNQNRTAGLSPQNEPTLEFLQQQFPWANAEELDLIKKEKLYLDADFNGEEHKKLP